MGKSYCCKWVFSVKDCIHLVRTTWSDELFKNCASLHRPPQICLVPEDALVKRSCSTNYFSILYQKSENKYVHNKSTLSYLRHPHNSFHISIWTISQLDDMLCEAVSNRCLLFKWCNLAKFFVAFGLNIYGYVFLCSNKK